MRDIRRGAVMTNDRVFVEDEEVRALLASIAPRSHARAEKTAMKAAPADVSESE